MNSFLRSANRKAFNYLQNKHRFCSISQLSIGVPKEIYKGEKRVALTPEGLQRLLKSGYHSVQIESGAGIGASISDEKYVQSGGKIVSTEDVYKSDVILKVRGPQ